METKICIACGEEKEIHNFALEGARGQFRRNKCKSCVRKWNALPKEERDRIKTEAKNAIKNRSEKKCPTCGDIKPRAEFYLSKSTLDGLTVECKRCDDNRRSLRRLRARNNRIAGNVVPPTHRICRECGVDKPIDQFNRNATYNDGVDTLCKECSRARYRKYSDDVNARVRWLLERLKSKCHRYNLEFDLTVDDITIPDKCPVLGIPLKFGADRAYGQNAGEDSPSVDRIDSSKGYTKDNIIVVSWRANRIKSNATPDELRLLSDFYNNMAKQFAK